MPDTVIDRIDTHRKRLGELLASLKIREKAAEMKALEAKMAAPTFWDRPDEAQMLKRMYTRWAERKGFKTEIVDLQEGEEAGIRNATLHVIGDYAYGQLRSELGCHRLIRISPFDAQARRQTSVSAVDVMP